MTQRPLARRLVVTSLIAVSISSLVGPHAARAQSPVGDTGAALYEESCASCHGPEGAGTDAGPSIENAGAAAADFQLRTGRMPLAEPGAQAQRKDSPFTDEQIGLLVDYVASLGSGPPIPEVDIEGREVAAGQEIYAANCAPCHGTTGTGGAVGPGALAPSLFRAEPVEIAEAMITGPGQMPLFDLEDEQRNDVVAYVRYLQNEQDPGGTDIGGIGPVPEGYVAWLVGGLGIILLCLFIGHSRRGERGDHEDEGAR
ncbi:MAG: c-type cytochrome [Actinomycetota bacterium]|nr:c-type cytochrome [Actinomycetota bacterium]